MKRRWYFIIPLVLALSTILFMEIVAYHPKPIYMSEWDAQPLSLPASHFTRPAIIPYQAAKSEEEQLTDWLRKNNPDAEVFIHEKPQERKLKEHGWERFPATWNGKQIWIKRKPIYDRKMQQWIEESA